MGIQTSLLASSEGNDPPDGIVGGHPDGHAISRDDLDSKPAHAAAQLGEHLMPLITLDPIKTAAMDRNYGPLHVDQIILAQLLSFPIKDCAILLPV